MVFNSSQAEYTQVLKINDPVLRNIELYFAEIYNELNTFCTLSCSSTGKNCIHQCKDHCEYLNKWLHEKEALYTSRGVTKSENYELLILRHSFIK